MSYVDTNLTKNETVIQKANSHWFVYVKGGAAVFIALMLMILSAGSGSAPFFQFIGTLLFLLGVGLMGYAFVIAKTTELAVTDKRVIAKYGIISRKTIEINLSKIEGLDVDQDILGRIFNYGDIIIGGTGGKKSPIKFIEKPLDFRRTVNEQVEA